MFGQKISCNVQSCKYNDKSEYCTLDNILVGNDGALATSKSQTECVSFEAE